MAAKLIVTTTKGGSRITLVGTSGTELLTSKVFTEPRGKGATLRSLRGLLGDDVIVEDQTLSTARKATEPAAPSGRKAVAAAPATASRRTRAVVKGDAPTDSVATADKSASKPGARRRKPASPKAAAAKPVPAKRGVGKKAKQ